MSSRFRVWVGHNIQRSVAVLKANQHRFPDGDYMSRYSAVCESLVRSVPRCKVLHMGCGAGHSAALGAKQSDSVFVGVDLQFSSLRNYPSSYKVLADLEHLPFAEGSFDVALSEEVFEHIESPREVLAGLACVLRSGGKVAFATPNKLGYISLISWFTPFWFHRWIQDVLNPDDPRSEHLFPTFYRLNTPWTIERKMLQAGFRKVRLEVTEGMAMDVASSSLVGSLGYPMGCHGAALFIIGSASKSYSGCI